MKPQIASSIEQSRRLLSCGVDPKTADMVWLNRGQYPAFLSFNEGCNRAIPEVGDVPAWSLSALLEMLPNEIKEDNDPYDEINEYRLYIYPYLQGWQIEYQYCEDDECHSLICIYDTSLIEACVQMIEWLTEHNYSLNKIEE